MPQAKPLHPLIFKNPRFFLCRPDGSMAVIEASGDVTAEYDPAEWDVTVTLTRKRKPLQAGSRVVLKRERMPKKPRQWEVVALRGEYAWIVSTAKEASPVGIVVAANILEPV
jgi:hypothetical protein